VIFTISQRLKFCVTTEERK